MTNAKNYSFLESSNFHYYKELVIKVAGDEDWEKSAGMYIKRYKGSTHTSDKIVR